MMTTSIRIASLIVVSVIAYAVQADTVTQVKNGANANGLSDSSVWGEEVSSANDYVATRALYVSSDSTAQSAGKNTFNGRSLTIGVVGGAAPTIYNYANGSASKAIANFTGEGGLVLANGSWLTRYGGTQVHYIKADAGGVTVTSPSTAPFKFGNYTTRCGGIIDISSKLRGQNTTGIMVVSSPCSDAGYTGYPVALRVSGDASDFLGTVVVSNTTIGGVEFRISGSASQFGGSVVVRNGATFKPEIATSIASLAIEDGAKLSLVAGMTLTVRDSLSVDGGPVPVALSGAPSATVGEVTRYALLTMPTESDCSASDFVVTNEGTSYTTAPDVYIADDGETKTLYAAYYPRISLESNNDSSSVSAITNGSYWSDGLAVHGFAHYLVSRLSGTTYISTPYEFDTPLVFPGVSLYFGAYTALNLCSKDYTISNVLFRGGSSRNTIIVPSGKDATLRGRFDLGSDTELRFVTRGSGIIRLSGPCSGTSSSVMSVYGSSAGTDQIRETVVLEGDHSGYAGKYIVTIQYPDKVVFDSRFLALRVSDAASLGGPRSEFTYDALKIERAGRLEAYDSFTMDEPTRGVFVSWQGRFYVLANKTLTLKEQLTVYGRVYKEGAGTLALGGALRFLDSEGALTSTPPADATNRTFYVMGGRVKPLSADALEGLDVVFSNKTSKLEVGLALDVAPADATLLAKGICNTNSAAPFAWQSDEASPKITIRLDCNDTTPRSSYDFGVMTLSTDVADSVFDRVKLIKPDGFARYGTKTRRTYDADANTATLHATLEPCGMVLFVQ